MSAFRRPPRLWAAAALTLALASCRKPVSAVLDQPVDLRVNQAASFAKSDLLMRFLRVASDSRCPPNVECITAGEAMITLECRRLKGPPATFDARLPGGAANDDSILWKPYDGYRIRVLRLVPLPVAGAAADTTAYVATFIVQKG